MSLVTMTGLSPRVRGNRFVVEEADVSSGPIPACAGQPRFGQIKTSVTGAYPRVCGATVLGVVLCAGIAGLSPRVRGNRPESEHAKALKGPIPACAGQPTRRSTAPACKRAYPRVCGATLVIAKADGFAKGLSPRVRGNLAIKTAQDAVTGPIPACAGQPHPQAAGRCSGRAYPRVCGATWPSSCSAVA